MSVIKSKRKLAKVQFLTNIANLQTDVRKWCRSQSPRLDSYGLTELHSYTEKAIDHALNANCRFITTQDDIVYRKKEFKAAISELHKFNAKVTRMSFTFDISNTRIKRWMSLSYNSIRQMEGVIKSDSTRLNK